MVDFPALPPVSPDNPCGPDLDLEGDADFLNYTASVEGFLPASFFSFDRKSVDLPSAIATGESLLARTHDLRLTLLLAKLHILNRDFEGFVRWVATTAELVRDRWEEVHPRAEGSDFAARLANLSTLDDAPVVVLPLQYATLLETRREGALNFRAQLIALGEAKARDGESFLSAGAIERLLASIEDEALARRLGDARRLCAALTSLRAVTMEHLGAEQASQFKALAPLADRIAGFLEAARTRRDPASSEPAAETADAPGAEPANAAAAANGPLDSLTDIDAALGAAYGYFAAREPSSPALLLIGQARDALGKNLYDVMRLLAPNHADAARVFVGPEGIFTVPVSNLSNAPSLEIERAETTPAASRQEALTRIDAVAAQLRRSEPSSPIPYLLERARALASRDFLSLLNEVLPEENLDSLKRGR